MSDNAQEARHLFRLVSFVCSIVFGVPLALVSIKIAMDVSSGPLGSVRYFYADALYAAILSALIVVPMLASYIYYRRLAAEKTA